MSRLLNARIEAQMLNVLVLEDGALGVLQSLRFS